MGQSAENTTSIKGASQPITENQMGPSPTVHHKQHLLQKSQFTHISENRELSGFNPITKLHQGAPVATTEPHVSESSGIYENFRQLQNAQRSNTNTGTGPTQPPEQAQQHVWMVPLETSQQVQPTCATQQQTASTQFTQPLNGKGMDGITQQPAEPVEVKIADLNASTSNSDVAGEDDGMDQSESDATSHNTDPAKAPQGTFGVFKPPNFGAESPFAGDGFAAGGELFKWMASAKDGEGPKRLRSRTYTKQGIITSPNGHRSKRQNTTKFVLNADSVEKLKQSQALAEIERKQAVEAKEAKKNPTGKPATDGQAAGEPNVFAATGVEDVETIATQLMRDIERSDVFAQDTRRLLKAKYSNRIKPSCIDKAIDQAAAQRQRQELRPPLPSGQPKRPMDESTPERKGVYISE